MWLEDVQNLSQNDQNWSEYVKNHANYPKNTQKVRKLLQKSYPQQKAMDMPSKSYCWFQSLLGTSSLGADTICTYEVDFGELIKLIYLIVTKLHDQLDQRKICDTKTSTQSCL